jgi:hypothetical protein
VATEPAAVDWTHLAAAGGGRSATPSHPRVLFQAPAQLTHPAHRPPPQIEQFLLHRARFRSRFLPASPIHTPPVWSPAPIYGKKWAILEKNLLLCELLRGFVLTWFWCRGVYRWAARRWSRRDRTAVGSLVPC